jgi:peptidyl-prolyl cis-trans isomerase C
MTLRCIKAAPWAKITCGLLLLGCVSAWAESAPAKSAGAVINVNGVAITETALNRVLTELQSQGAALTPQLREQVLSELVVRQVLVAEATRRGLEKAPAYTQQLDELRKRLLVDALVNDNLAKNPITEADERAEYARQKKILGDADTTPQYFLSQVVLKTEQQARDVIAAARSGTAFDKLAQESVDEASKAQGGKVGWLFPTDMLPAIGTVVVNLAKGTVAAAPIQSPAGWHVIRVDDVRPFKIPSFEESRAQIRQSLQLQRRQALVEGLLKGADIQRP